MLNCFIFDPLAQIGAHYLGKSSFPYVNRTVTGAAVTSRPNFHDLLEMTRRMFILDRLVKELRQTNKLNFLRRFA